MLPPYTKPHLSFTDQLALLMARGLVVTDQAKALLHLERIGYGRLTPYWQPFQQLVSDPDDATRTIRTEQFQAPSSATPLISICSTSSFVSFSSMRSSGSKSRCAWI